MIQVHYFAHLREQTGVASETFPLAGKTIAILKETLTQKYPLVTIAQMMIAVNEEFVQEETILADGDVVAFIPPVSGG